MHHITLIYSRHEEIGACNANALCRIIEIIQPNVIFEELTENLFNRAYVENAKTNLESNAIKAYLNNHSVEHIPVDTFPLPDKYYEQINRLDRILLNSKRFLAGRQLNYLLEIEFLPKIEKYGFDFLNHSDNTKIFQAIQDNRLKEKVLEERGDPELFRIYNLEKEIIAERE